MKHIKRLAVLFFIVVLASCNSKEENLIGYWKVTDYETDVEGTADASEEPESVVLSTSYDFKPDGTLIVNSKMVKNEKGDYTLKGDSLILNYKIGSGDKKAFGNYALKKLTSKKMVLQYSFENWGYFNTILEKQGKKSY